jgi:hypothetical protein
MADIFISYASVDRPTARRLAEALEARGWSVWWDYRIRAGDNFHRAIQKAISASTVVIVIWSQNSVDSDWVLAEASQALDEKKLVPLRIDMASLPLRFRNIHTIDLSSWTGQTEAEPFEKLIETLSHYLGLSNSSNRPEQPGTQIEPSSQAEPTDRTETVPIADHPGASPNSGSFHAGGATEHRVSTAGLTFPAGHKRVSKYFAVVVITGGVLLGVVVLGEKQQASPTKPSNGHGEYATRSAGKTADQANAVAQNNLGRLYQNGWGVPQDYAEAARWYHKAADQGNADAQNNLGWLYQNGWGVPQDYAEALRWYRKAADQGNADAQSMVSARERR